MTAADTLALRAELVAQHALLVRYGLVVWTGGNASARVPGEDRFLIKPSGVDYDDLSADDMILCDLDGKVVDGDHAPSSDTAAHAYQTAVDVASLAPNAEVTVYPWKEPPELKARTINRVRSFLKRHQPSTAAR